MFEKYTFDIKDPSNNHSFEIHDVDLAIVNGLRRTILTDIPIPGIIGEKLDKEEPTVTIINNTGALHNEFIIHRIGLIPICLTEEEIESYEDNSLVIELNVKNETPKIINVKTNDIKAYMNDDPVPEKKLVELFPPNKVSNDNILITLAPGSKLTPVYLISDNGVNDTVAASVSALTYDGEGNTRFYRRSMTQNFGGAILPLCQTFSDVHTVEVNSVIAGKVSNTNSKKKKYVIREN